MKQIGIFIEATRTNPEILKLDLDSNDADRKSMKELGIVLRKNLSRQNQMVVPKLRDSIDRLSYDLGRVDALRLKMERITKEKSQIFQKTSEQQLDQVRGLESKKTADMEDERSRCEAYLRELCLDL